MPPTWNSDSHEEPAKEFVCELNHLAEEYSSCIYRDKGDSALMIKDKKSKKKLIEYWPEQNIILNTRHDHKQAGVPQELSDDYHSAIEIFGKPVEDYNIFIEHLRKIIEALSSGSSPTAKPQSEPDRTAIMNTQDHGFYFPTREDFDNARRKCLREGRKSISIDDMLGILENDLKEAGHKLAENWRSVTEENIAIWSQKKD